MKTLNIIKCILLFLVLSGTGAYAQNITAWSVLEYDSIAPASVVTKGTRLAYSKKYNSFYRWDVICSCWKRFAGPGITDTTYSLSFSSPNLSLLGSGSSVSLTSLYTAGWGLTKTSEEFKVDTSKVATRYYTSTLPTSILAGQVAYSNGNNLVGSPNHFWDNTNARLGIGIGTPLVKLDLGTFGSTSTVIRAGRMEQTIFSSGYVLADNIFHNGTNFVRRSAGTGSMIVGFNGEIQFRTDTTSRSANTYVANLDNTAQFKILGNGGFVSGKGLGATPNSLSGATFYHNGSTGQTAFGSASLPTGVLVNFDAQTRGIRFPMQTLAQADAITGVQGNFQYETTQNGLRWYNGTRKAYALESTFARGTATRVPFFDANGQVTESSLLSFVSATGQFKASRYTFNTATGFELVPFGSTELAILAPTNGMVTFYGDGADFIPFFTNQDLGNINRVWSTIYGNNLIFSAAGTASSPSIRYRIAGNNIGAGMYFVGNLANHDLGFSTNSTARLYLTYSGLVGVGTTTPLQELDVNGDAYIRDSLRLTTTPAHTSITGLLTRDANGWVGMASTSGLGYSGGVLTAQNIGNTDLTLTGSRILNSGGFPLRLAPNTTIGGTLKVASLTNHATPDSIVTTVAGVLGKKKFLKDAANYFDGSTEGFYFDGAVGGLDIVSGSNYGGTYITHDYYETTAYNAGGEYSSVYGGLSGLATFAQMEVYASGYNGQFYLDVDQGQITSWDVGSGVSVLSVLSPIGVQRYNTYGVGNREAGDLSRTASAYLAGFATDGTLLDYPISSLATTWLKPALESGSNVKISSSNSLTFKQGTTRWTRSSEQTGTYISSGFMGVYKHTAGTFGGIIAFGDTIDRDNAFYLTQDDRSIIQNYGTGRQFTIVAENTSLPGTYRWAFGARVDTSTTALSTLRVMLGDRYASALAPVTVSVNAGVQPSESVANAAVGITVLGDAGKKAFTVNDGITLRMNGKVYFGLDSTLSFNPTTDLLQLSQMGIGNKKASDGGFNKPTHLAAFTPSGTGQGTIVDYPLDSIPTNSIYNNLPNGNVSIDADGNNLEFNNISSFFLGGVDGSGQFYFDDYEIALTSEENVDIESGTNANPYQAKVVLASQNQSLVRLDVENRFGYNQVRLDSTDFTISEAKTGSTRDTLFKVDFEGDESGLVTFGNYTSAAPFTSLTLGEDATDLFLTTTSTTGKVIGKAMRQTTNVKDADLTVTDDMLDLSMDIHVWAYCSNAASDSVVIDLPTPGTDYLGQMVSVYGDGRNATLNRDVYVRCVGAKLWHGFASPTAETYYQVTSLTGAINSRTAEFICVQNPDDNLYYWQLKQHP